MRCGQFAPDGREFIISEPRTPRPWHNYLCNDRYLVNLTQLGLGASFYQPRGEGLRANLTEDRDGAGGPRFVYLRDNDSGSYWSLTGAPPDRSAARVSKSRRIGTPLRSRLRTVAAPNASCTCVDLLSKASQQGRERESSAPGDRR